MATSRETNTMAEGLQKIMRDISGMKTMPDSDLDMLNSMEKSIIDYLRPPTPEPPMGAGPMGGMGGLGMGGGSPMGPPMASGPPPPGLVGQAPSLPDIPPDMLAQLMGGGPPTGA